MVVRHILERLLALPSGIGMVMELMPTEQAEAFRLVWVLLGGQS